MIKTRKDLNRFLSEEKCFYRGYTGGLRGMLSSLLYNGTSTRIYRYVRLLRYTEYYHNNSYKITHKWSNILNDIFMIYYRHKLEKLGALLGLEIGLNSCDCGLKIYHAGYLVVNYEARVGRNAKFHGCNCVGYSTSGVPIIGDNVEFGVGSSVIGGVRIADNIRIGAGAVVTKSYDEKNIVLAGVPARKLNRSTN